MLEEATEFVLDATSPVAIFGMGVSGRGAAALLDKHGFSWVGYDSNSAYTSWKKEYAGTHRQVVVSPGFAANHPWISDAQSAGLELFSEIDLAARFWPGRLVGVTGTNGKTTLTAFLAQVFECAGFESIAVGNIGSSFAGVLARREFSNQAVAVCEVSSFQAEQTRSVCWDGLIWTNFAEDHLERHQSIEDYFLAKARLLKQVSAGAPIVFGKSVSEAAQRFEVILPSSSFNGDFDVGDPIPTGFQSVPQAKNFRQVCVFWRLWGGEMEAVEDAAEVFEMPPHRLEKISVDAEGLNFWDDSKATNFAATLAAIESMDGAPIIWIGGGMSKGGDTEAFVASLAERISGAVLLGTEQGPLKTALLARGIRVAGSVDMKNAVEGALEIAKSYASAHILLSPGFSSLDEYSGYADRGRAFQESVKAAFNRNLLANP